MKTYVIKITGKAFRCLVNVKADSFELAWRYADQLRDKMDDPNSVLMIEELRISTIQEIYVDNIEE